MPAIYMAIRAKSKQRRKHKPIERIKEYERPVRGKEFPHYEELSPLESQLPEDQRQRTEAAAQRRNNRTKDY